MKVTKVNINRGVPVRTAIGTQRAIAAHQSGALWFSSRRWPIGVNSIALGDPVGRTYAMIHGTITTNRNKNKPSSKNKDKNKAIADSGHTWYGGAI